MRPRHVGASHASFDDDTVWPLAMSGSDEDDDITWILLYGTDEARKACAAHAVSIISAYRALLGMTNKRRNEVANAIRYARTIKPAKAGEG